MSKKNKGLLYSAVILTIFCLSYFPAQAQNHQYDLSLDASDIRFSKDVLIAGVTLSEKPVSVVVWLGPEEGKDLKEDATALPVVGPLYKQIMDYLLTQYPAA